MAFETAIFRALEDVKSLQLPTGIPSSGKRFEDFMFKQLYQVVRKPGAPDVYPPRHTLRSPTYSGVAHQFDIVIRENQLTAVECKFRRRIGIDALFAFVGKLVDYRQPPHGLFVTTAEDLNDDCFCYAIAHRISIVCPSLPPVEYMMRCVESDTDLARRLASLLTDLQDIPAPRRILIRWRNEHRRFVAEGHRS